jgi:hypothetical protein
MPATKSIRRQQSWTIMISVNASRMLFVVTRACTLPRDRPGRQPKTHPLTSRSLKTAGDVVAGRI